MVARTRYQDDWVLNLYRAMQAAIGQQLTIEYESPRELTPELAIVLRKLDEPSHEAVSVDGLITHSLDFGWTEDITPHPSPAFRR